MNLKSVQKGEQLIREWFDGGIYCRETALDKKKIFGTARR